MHKFGMSINLYNNVVTRYRLIAFWMCPECMKWLLRVQSPLFFCLSPLVLISFIYILWGGGGAVGLSRKVQGGAGTLV